jgi:hypothetical protein
MLKIRNLIFALGLSPLIFAVWQLPSQAGGPPPGTESGNNNLQGSTITPISNPGGGTGAGAGTGTGTGTTTTTATIGGETVTTPALVTTTTTDTGAPVIIPIIDGVSATITSGVSTTGTTSAATTIGGDIGVTVAITAATVESDSSSITVTDGATANTVVITLAPQAQVVVNQLAAAIVQNLNSIITGGGTTGGGTTGGGTADGGTTGGGTTGGGTADGGTTGGGTADGTVADVGTLLTGGAGAQQAAVALTNSFTAAGISPQLATALVTSLTGLFPSTSASLPNQPVAMATSGQLVASTKAFKPVYVIAQGSARISVNINKLNDAIIAYNSMILTAKPQAVKNLSNNTGFRGIGGILKQLRTAVK